MVTHEWRESALPLQAGRLCLEFANTNDWHASQRPVEKLHAYADLVAWGQGVGLLADDEAAALLAAAAHRPAEAEAALVRARRLREAIYRIFSALAAGREPPADDLAALNAAIARSYASQRLAQSAQSFAWTWDHDPADLDRILWPVARSAADLLTSDQLERVGECADDRGCGWLFLDTSRNHSRRWCGMEACGNRAKARRHYERKRSAAQPA